MKESANNSSESIKTIIIVILIIAVLFDGKIMVVLFILIACIIYKMNKDEFRVTEKMKFLTMMSLIKKVILEMVSGDEVNSDTKEDNKEEKIR